MAFIECFDWIGGIAQTRCCETRNNSQRIGGFAKN
jgi:hypothetical protein